MAQVRPFKAVRPAKEHAAEVVSLPYDVMNRAEAAEMAKDKPNSFLHICRAEIDLPEEKDQYAQSVYEKARDNISDFLERGVFVEEEKKVYYIYRQIMNGNIQTGIVALASIDDYINNVIKKHEFTRVEKEIDRINHFDIASAHTEPVFLTYKDENSLRKIINEYADTNAPLYDLVTDDDVTHIMWKIESDAIIEDITNQFKDIPALYIADGHHRSASSCKVGLKRREENPDYDGTEEFNFFMTVIFPDSDLEVFDYNRVVKDLNGLTAEEFLTKVKEAGFEVEEVSEEHKPTAKNTFGMLIKDKWYKLTAKTEIIPNDVVNSLDVAILQNYILNPILGIEDPRTDKRIDFVGGIRGIEGLVKRVNNDMEIAFAVYPVDIKDLIEVSDNDMIMPPKSTWFEPKLGSGLFLHRF